MFAQESIDDLAARIADWIATVDAPPPPKRRHPLRFLFVFVGILGLWRFLQRPGRAEQSTNEEAEPEPAAAPAPTADPESRTPTADPESCTEVAPPPESESRVKVAPPHGPVLLKPSDRRYAIKWTDCSGGQEVAQQKRDLTFEQAQKEAAWFLHHNRRFYPGAEAKRSPFARLQVWLQCVCGRDVVDLRDPHTVPGEDRICVYSGTARRTTRAGAQPATDPAPRPLARVDATSRPITGARRESDRVASARTN